MFLSVALWIKCIVLDVVEILIGFQFALIDRWAIHHAGQFGSGTDIYLVDGGEFTGEIGVNLGDGWGIDIRMVVVTGGMYETWVCKSGHSIHCLSDKFS